MHFKRWNQIPFAVLIATVIGNLGSTVLAAPLRTFTDWCLNSDIATSGQRQVIQLLKDISQKDDCAAADRHLRERLALTVNGLKLTDVEVFTALPQLTQLNLENNNITDWRPLRHLPNLKSLNLRDNLIADASPIAAMPQLERIDLSGNPLQDYGPLVAVAEQVKVRAQRPRQALLVPSSMDLRPGYQLGKVDPWTRRANSLSPATPAQVFEFQVEPGSLQIFLDPESSQTLAISLYQKNEDGPVPWFPIDFPQLNPHGEQTIQYSVSEAGTYHLFVHQDPSHTNDTDFSLLLMHGLAAPSLEQEPNNNLSEIESLPSFHSQQQTLHLKGSISTDIDPIDNWKFTLQQPSRLRLLVKANQGPAAIELYDANGQQIAFFSTGEVKTLRTLRRDGIAAIDLDPLKAGTYFLRIRPDDDASSVAYQIVLTGNPIPPNSLN